jgi:AcrR family transcriptional regulator
MTIRKEQSIKTREKIVEAVRILIQQKDFELITVQDITTKAKVAKGSFYTYFKRKEDVLYEIGLQPFINLSQEVEEMQTKNIIEKLTYYYAQFMQGVESFGINICRGWVRDVINPHNLTNDLGQTKWDFDIEKVKNILKKSVEQGELKSDTPIDTLSHIINSQLYGMTVGWCMSDMKFEPLDWVDEFCKIQLKQILAQYINK